MAFEPWQQRWPGGSSPRAGEEFKPADEDVIRTLAEIEKASTPVLSATSNTPIGPGMPDPQTTRRASAGTPGPAARAIAIAVGIAAGFAIIGLNVARQMSSSPGYSRRAPRVLARSTLNAAAQAEAEQLLQRVAAGESGAADEVLERSTDWTNKTQRTPKSEQSVSVALNLPDLHAREAAVRAELALDGVTADDAGLRTVEQAVGNPRQRVWALWMLGALANRGVDPGHAAKVIETYMSDPQPEVRAAAVNGLAIVGTGETIPMMLDRFRNDPSPVVQERAACSLAESGMYTHQQRMTAAGSLVRWLDDPLITGQQRGWTVQALHDISGQNFGTNSAAWREWYAGAR